jgi:hypothetical protein
MIKYFVDYISTASYMLMKFETLLLLSLFCLVLLPVKVLYGVTESFNDDSPPVAQAKYKIENDTRYLNTLINYTRAHNITMVADPEVVARIIHLSEFEDMVKKHTEYCKDKPAGPITGEPFYKPWWNSNGDC